MAHLGRLVLAFACTIFILQATGIAVLVPVEDKQCKDEPFGCLPISCPNCVGCDHSPPIALAPVYTPSLVATPAARWTTGYSDERLVSADPEDILHIPKSSSAS